MTEKRLREIIREELESFKDNDRNFDYVRLAIRHGWPVEKINKELAFFKVETETVRKILSGKITE